MGNTTVSGFRNKRQATSIDHCPAGQPPSPHPLVGTCPGVVRRGLRPDASPLGIPDKLRTANGIFAMDLEQEFQKHALDCELMAKLTRDAERERIGGSWRSASASAPSGPTCLALRQRSINREHRGGSWLFEDHCETLLSMRSGSQSSSLTFWSLLGPNGASGPPRRRVQCHGVTNERFQGVCVNLVILLEIDGTPGVAFQA